MHMHTCTQVPISLFVASRTACAAWGRVLTNETCAGTRLSEVRLVVGVVSHVSFTACDDEALPVAHGLPSSVDDRRFTARHGETQRAVFYLGGGAYEVAMQAEKHGMDVMQIGLDGAPAAPPLNLLATCPFIGRTAALVTGAMCCRSCVHSRVPSECSRAAITTKQDAPSLLRWHETHTMWLSDRFDAILCLIDMRR